ncbi:MAG: hypothetical protein E6357_27975, partial [Clostridiales bacterium]|nr:hypothetical protein [Clostridiales bacterium]
KFESGGFCVLLLRKDLKTYVFQCPRFSQHDGTLGLWHAGRDWRKATDVKQLILRTAFVFHSAIRKRSRRYLLLCINSQKYTAIHPIKNSQPHPSFCTLLSFTKRPLLS